MFNKVEKKYIRLTPMQNYTNFYNNSKRNYYKMTLYIEKE